MIPGDMVARPRAQQLEDLMRIRVVANQVPKHEEVRDVNARGFIEHGAQRHVIAVDVRENRDLHAVRS